MSEIVVKLQARTSRIRFESPSIDPTAIIITDSNVAPRLKGSTQRMVTIPAGETSKNFDQFVSVQRQLAQFKASRKTTFVAIGGGVVGDLAGFVAATYMRGVRLIQVPTTLLAMVDSSVGGKVGIDLPEGKNLVGAFYPADEVFIDAAWLSSLPERQFRCGMAEVIKYGFIQDQSLLEALDNAPLTEANDVRLTKVIRRCVELKKEVVEEDEFETTGRRAILNFGHTVGHALETLTNYETFTHGEAIAIGMVAELRVGQKLGLSTQNLTERAINIFTAHGLPVQLPKQIDVDAILEAMRLDKKSENQDLTMSLVSEPGVCRLVKDIDPDLVREALFES